MADVSPAVEDKVEVASSEQAKFMYLKEDNDDDDDDDRSSRSKQQQKKEKNRK